MPASKIGQSENLVAPVKWLRDLQSKSLTDTIGAAMSSICVKSVGQISCGDVGRGYDAHLLRHRRGHRDAICRALLFTAPTAPCAVRIIIDASCDINRRGEVFTRQLLET